jgi:type III pantothenate kinase
MYLLVDAGNSRIKYAWHDGRRWLQQLSCASDDPQLQLTDAPRPVRIVIANVAGKAVASALAAQLERLNAPIEWLQASAERCGLRCAYAEPARLGADRWAATIGAWRQIQDDCLVICAGTATTIDLLRAGGEHAGGCILPGLGMMLEALARGTAALPHAQGSLSLPATNTDDAITSGCLIAQSGAIAHMASLCPPGTPILLTGGHAPALAPLLGANCRIAPLLILEGLLEIATNGHAR